MTDAQLTTVDYLDAIRRHGDGFAYAADGNLSTDVSACPGWRVADLVWHLGEVHDFWRRIAEERLDDPNLMDRDLERPAAEELVAWYRDGVERLHVVLRDSDPATPCWSWSPRKNIGFIVRRMAQETAVHRWDAETAAGHDFAIEPRLAVDGIDEFLDLMVPDANRDAEAPGGSVHLHATDVTDGTGEWQVGDDHGALVVRREHAKGDAAVRGTASNLLLLLWRRTPPAAAAFERFGDGNVLAQFLAHTNLE